MPYDCNTLSKKSLGKALFLSTLFTLNLSSKIDKFLSLIMEFNLFFIKCLDYAVEKASFLRLNNITIGYSLPKTIVRRAFMQNVRIYLTGYNLFCWTNYSGADPEVDTSSKKNAMTPGIDYAAYPKSRTFVGGINVTF